MRKLELNKSNDIEGTEKKAIVKTIKPKCILEAFEHIIKMVKGSNLDDDFFENASTYIKYASRKLKLSSMQTVLLSLFVDRSDDNSIRIYELAKDTGCSTTKLLRLRNDIDVLEAKHYIRSSISHNTTSYRVPKKVLDALRNNQAYVYTPEPTFNTYSFFENFSRLMEEKGNNELTYDSLKEHTLDMLKEIKDTLFAKKIRCYNLDSEDTLLLIYMAHLFVENNDDNIGFHDIENIYDNDNIPPRIKHLFRSRNLDLFGKNIIENVNEEGMGRTDAFKLTNSAKEELLVELDLNTIADSTKGLIQADSLSEKTLIYNESEQEQIKELSSILSEDRFNHVQSRLRDAGMRPGFCCIFYGAPGTGKTETVYQIARQTGRAILCVDVDRIKSCWVGESEKNIKSLFDRYRNICKKSKLAPILLFNEADAVLGVRMEGASRAVDKMENSIQNIILQEMETLEGIMIATTNLTSNLDKAFERRFLYKIRFDKPTVEARSMIWQAMLKGLSGKDACVLASQFDLSGGEIENIARKHSVNAILSGNDDIDLEEIIATCRHERLNKTSHSKIGF